MQGRDEMPAAKVIKTFFWRGKTKIWEEDVVAVIKTISLLSSFDLASEPGGLINFTSVSKTAIDVLLYT